MSAAFGPEVRTLQQLRLSFQLLSPQNQASASPYHHHGASEPWAEVCPLCQALYKHNLRRLPRLARHQLRQQRNLPDPPDYARTWPFLSNYLLQGEKKQLGVQLSIHVKEPRPPPHPSHSRKINTSCCRCCQGSWGKSTTKILRLKVTSHKVPCERAGRAHQRLMALQGLDLSALGGSVERTNKG